MTKTMGSEKVSTKAEPSTASWLDATALPAAASISDWLRSFTLPVALRSRFARRYRIVAALLSGMQKNSSTTTAAPIQHTIQTVNRHPLACAAKPPNIGPNTGPQIPKLPQMQKPYATLAGEYMSAMVAPPVARAGLPTKPARKRKVRKVGRLGA